MTKQNTNLLSRAVLRRWEAPGPTPSPKPALLLSYRCPDTDKHKVMRGPENDCTRWRP